MPMVPTFQREDLPQAQATGPQADIAAAGIPGEALERLGEAGVDYAGKTIQADAYNWTATNTADFAESQTDAAIAARKQAVTSGDYKGVTTGYIQQLDADQAQRAANAPTTRAGEAFTLHAKGVRDQLVRSMSEFADQGEYSAWNSNKETNLGKLATSSYRSPQLAETNYGIGLGIIQGAQAAGIGGDKVDWAAQIHAWGAQNYGAVIKQGIDTNPAGTLADLNNGKFDFALHSGEVEQYTHQAQYAVDRNEQRQQAAMERGLAMQAHADAMAERNLRATQGQTEATLLANAVNPGPNSPPLDPAHASDLLRTQQLSPEGYNAVIHAQEGRDDPTATLHLYGAMQRGDLAPADIMTAVANHQISGSTGVELQRGLNEQAKSGANSVERSSFDTLKTALDGTAAETGLGDVMGGNRAQAQQLWTQAQGEWTRRVMIGHQDPTAVLSDMMPRYAPKATLPTWLPQPQAGAITDPNTLPVIVQQTQAAFRAGQLTQDQYATQGALLMQYQQFFDAKAKRDAAIAAARLQRQAATSASGAAAPSGE